MRVWPAVPAPGELVRLPLPCPPQLIELSSYTGGGRLVALWWSPFGDRLMISDGRLTETRRWRGWLCFCEHPLARLFLEPYRLGDSEDEGEHRLLVDRYLGTLDVGLARGRQPREAIELMVARGLTTRRIGAPRHRRPSPPARQKMQVAERPSGAPDRALLDADEQQLEEARGRLAALVWPPRAQHRADRASLRILGIRDRDELALPMLVGLGAADGDEQPSNSVEAQVLRVYRDELGAAKRRGEPQQQQRTIAQTGERACLDQLDHPRERLKLKRLRLTL